MNLVMVVDLGAQFQLLGNLVNERLTEFLFSCRLISFM